MQATAHDLLRRWGATVLRLTVGFIFLAHGAQKLFGDGSGASRVAVPEDANFVTLPSRG